MSNWKRERNKWVKRTDGGIYIAFNTGNMKHGGMFLWCGGMTDDPMTYEPVLGTMSWGRTLGHVKQALYMEERRTRMAINGSNGR